MEFFAFIGLAIVIIGSIGFLIAAFKQSILWGLGCLLFAPISFIFLFMHWPEAKNPFLLQLVGILVLFLAALTQAETGI